MNNIDAQILAEAKKWTNNQLISQELRQEIQRLIDQGSSAELTDRFFQDIEFGTGGIRGKVGAGLNRMNAWNVCKASQAVCRYALTHNFRSQNKTAVVCHDSRNTSPAFARETVQVLAGNGYTVYVFPYPSATPLLSYLIRRLKCRFGVNLTASHNPPQYNGFKVFWEEGEQVVPPADKGIIAEAKTIKGQDVVSLPYDEALAKGLVLEVKEEDVATYYSDVSKDLHGSAEANQKLVATYTPLHGVGGRFVTELAKRRGLSGMSYVANQMNPDGNFPTINTPNPEELKAFDEGIKSSTPATDLILATDPDADRVGCMCRGADGKFTFLTGNQIGLLLIDHILGSLKAQNSLKPDSYAVTTIVSSPAIELVAKKYGVPTLYCYTGFKNIAQTIAEQESTGNNSFVFGCEESHGYLISQSMRDKDGISGAIALAECAAGLKAQGKTLIDKLDELLGEIGFFADGIKNYVLEGAQGKQQIASLMNRLRTSPPQKIENGELAVVEDYQTLQKKSFDGQPAKAIQGFEPSNTLALHYSQNIRIMARPSGTEPKIKFYITLSSPQKETSSARMLQVVQALDSWIQQAL